VDTLKNKRARSVPLVEDPVPVVDRWSAGKAPDARPFDAPEGGPLRESNWKRSVGWSAATAAAGIPGFRVHDLRHTAASVWLGAGADPKVIQRALGHASAAMTMDLHGHLMDGNLWQAARVVGGISGHLSCLSSTTRAPMNWRRTEMPGERGFLPERSSRLGLTWAYGVWLGCCPRVNRGQPTFSGGLSSGSGFCWRGLAASMISRVRSWSSLSRARSFFALSNRGWYSASSAGLRRLVIV
jgi:hypothetical protein